MAVNPNARAEEDTRTPEELLDIIEEKGREVAEVLAANGRSMGVTFVPGFVDAEAPTLERLLDHVDHAVQLVGADHVGIGSNFDGGGTLLEDAAAFPRITDGLLERGYSEGDVKKVLGENHLRVLREALGGEGSKK